MSSPGKPSAQRRPKNGRNALYWIALVIFVGMAVASFPFWFDSQVGPTIFGLPISYTYHLFYILATVPVLWLLFKAIWPPGDD